MELMLQEAELWAAEYNVTFSTDPNPQKSNSKLNYMCGSNTRLPKPADILLCGHALPWVSSATHLGHEIHESGDMTYDGKVKRAQYIGKSVEVRDIFNFASPPEVLTAQDNYCTSYYSCLAGWDLGSTAATSARAEVMARFAGFFTGLRNSPSAEVRTVALLCARSAW